MNSLQSKLPVWGNGCSERFYGLALLSFNLDIHAPRTISVCYIQVIAMS